MEPEPFRWDFSDGKEYRYDFSNTVDMTQSSDMLEGKGIDGWSHLDAKGEITLKAGNDHTARMVMQNMERTVKIKMKDGQEKTVSKREPNSVMEGVTETSESELESSQRTTLKMFFPLPETPLKIGETGEVPVSMPLNVMGSALQLKGTIKITFVGFVAWEGTKCAELDFDIDVGPFKKPPEMEGTYIASVKGVGKAFFDLSNQRFTETHAAFVMANEIDVPIPDFSLQAKRHRNHRRDYNSTRSAITTSISG